MLNQIKKIFHCFVSSIYPYIIIPILLFNSCKVSSPAEDIPSYISVPSISFHCDPSQFGTNSSHITDCWVYVDDNLAGAFELPAKFPVLKEGTHHFSIRAGIKVNGMSENRLAYPFYQTYNTDVMLVNDSIIILKPGITYDTSAIFGWKEDFEGAGFSIQSIPGSDPVQKVCHNANVFEGSCSAGLIMSSTQNNFECGSVQQFLLPNNGKVFLELNYKNTISFNVGIYATTLTQVIQMPAITIFPSANWGKIYVNFSEQVASQPSAIYNIYFNFARDANIQDEEVYIDNIKLVY